MLVSERGGAEFASTLGQDGRVTVVRGDFDSVTPAAVSDAVSWTHTHPGKNQVAPSFEDLVFARRDAFRNTDMVIESRAADGSVAQLRFTPSEQAQLRTMLNENATFLDRYTRDYAEFVYNKYKEKGYSVEGADLQTIMQHVGYVPPP